MSGLFNEREHGFEAKFSHEEEMHFRTLAHRTHELGIWAGEQLGKSPDATAAYADSLVAFFVHGQNREALSAKILADFRDANKPLTRAQLQQQIEKIAAANPEGTK